MNESNNNSKKHLVVSEELHSNLKIEAIKRKKDLRELTEELLKEALEG